MKQIAVCDDDADFLKQARALCRRYCDESGEAACISCYPDAESLLASRAHHDIYLLDILMPGMDGIALAKKLAERDNGYCVIYLTTSEEYALDAFAVDAVQYLVKPVEEAALFAALRKAGALLAAPPEPEAPRLPVPTPDGTVTIALSRLMLVEYLDRVLYFYLSDGGAVRSSVSAMKISDVAKDLLALPNFLSPHRAFLVNMDYLRTFSTTEIKMENGKTVPVARATSGEARRRYMEYLLTKKGAVKC